MQSPQHPRSSRNALRAPASPHWWCLAVAWVLCVELPAAAQGQEIHARLQYDFMRSQDGGFGNTARFRRQRLLADWETGRLRLRGQAEFTQDARVLELYGDVGELPFGSVRLGHFREPQGMESHTSSAYTSFLERAAPVDAFTPGRNDGVRFSGLIGGWAWSAGVFQQADDVDGPRGDSRSVTARAVRVFGDPDPAGTLVHMGVSASARDPRGDSVRFSARAGTNLIGRQVDTGDLDADDVQVLGLEGAWRGGPLSFQSEAYLSRVDLDHGGTADLWGAYAQAAYTLTGEGRGYSTSRSAFTGIDPDAGYTSGGRGAWELAARLSRTDLEDGSVEGDRQDALTLGLNIYLTDTARLSLDWVHFDLDEADETGELLLARLQVGI